MTPAAPPSSYVPALLAEWGLTPDGAPVLAARAHVLPVRTERNRPAVLKIAAPDPEAEHEALALQHWHGRGAVRLLRADPHRHALLLERLTGEDLGDHWDVQAAETVGRLYAQLHVLAPPQLMSVSEYVDRGLARAAAANLPRRLVQQAQALARDLARDQASAPGDRLLHTDLHYAHVLSDGTDWVAIAPRPLAGDPHFEPAPLLWHRFDELAGRVRDGVRDRFFAVIDAAGLDEERAKAWVVVRAVLLATRAPDLTTVAIAVAKAVQE